MYRLHAAAALLLLAPPLPAVARPPRGLGEPGNPHESEVDGVGGNSPWDRRLTTTNPCGEAASEWIDPDTNPSHCAIVDSDGDAHELVFSDEFEVAGRTFTDGHDPKWTAVAGFPSTNQQVNAYDNTQDFVTTANGSLRIKFDLSRQFLDFTDYNLNPPQGTAARNFTSGMLQSWDKFCFTEGVLEFSVRFPPLRGLWPAVWTLGNLGRATLTQTTEGLFPYSYDQCPGVDNTEANQDPRQYQAINKCLSPRETRKYGLNDRQGRGVTEIDVVEYMYGSEGEVLDYEERVQAGTCPALTSDEYEALRLDYPLSVASVQLGPGFPHQSDQRPQDVYDGSAAACLPSFDDGEWYPELRPGSDAYGTEYNSTVNYDFYGFFLPPRQPDTWSAKSEVPRDTARTQHVYRLEWKAGSDGHVRVFMDGKLMYQVDAAVFTTERTVSFGGGVIGTLLGRQVPEEPMSLLVNIDVSTVWGWHDPPECQGLCTDCTDDACTTCMVDGVNRRAWLQEMCAALPGYMELDYMRVFQKPGSHNYDCSPPEYPTEGWIKASTDKFLMVNSDEPLRPVLAGGSTCVANEDCGSGVCNAQQVCECDEGWTGPRCLVRKVGAAATCSVLEEAAVGGAPCFESSPTDCGALEGRGSCVKVAVPASFPFQYRVLPDGTTEAMGGGDGRCSCAPGWRGARCGRPSAAAAPRRNASLCVPEPSQSGGVLDSLVTDLCSSPAFAAGAAEACAAVQWKARSKSVHEDGGELSRCGAFLRASHVVEAVHNATGKCCSTAEACAEEIPRKFDSGGCFPEADYGNQDRGACGWATLTGLYAPWPVVSGIIYQPWWHPNNTWSAVEVSSAAACQCHCQEVNAVGRCDFFKWVQESKSCFLVSELPCEDLTLNLPYAPAVFSGPREGCLLQQGAELVARPSAYYRQDDHGCFVAADYGQQSLGACADATVVGLYAPQGELDSLRSQAWFPAEAVGQAVTVRSASECQEFCKEVQGCDFFKWVEVTMACFMVQAVQCSAGALALGLGQQCGVFSGPRDGCIAQDDFGNLTLVPFPPVASMSTTYQDVETTLTSSGLDDLTTSTEPGVTTTDGVDGGDVLSSSSTTGMLESTTDTDSSGTCAWGPGHAFAAHGAALLLLFLHLARFSVSV